MRSWNLLRLGLIGTIVTAVCCATPILVILFGAVGLGGMVAYLDFALLPLLAVFVGVTGFALVQRRRAGRTE